MSTLQEIVTEAEAFVDDFLSCFRETQGESVARLMTVSTDNGIVSVEPVASHPDVYSLIDEVIAETPFTVRSADILAILTSGWAAPLTNGEVTGAPSAHPERRRVRLMTFVRRSDLKMASVLRFGDTNETVYDDGEATGSLAEALLSLGDAGK